MTADARLCPDGGTCHHRCEGDYCFRVATCEPLSGVFSRDAWPAAIVDRHGRDDGKPRVENALVGRALGEEACKMLGAAVHPVTGELLDVRGSSALELADALEELSRHYDALADFKAAIVAEVCRRADRQNARTVELDGVKWEVNAPTVDTYNLGELLAALRPFTEGDDPALDPSILNRVTRHPAPKRPPPEVDKRELEKLWKSDNRELLAALARVRQRGTPKRTAKVLARPVDTTAEELPDA